ncbi:PDZ domain-containing protein [bacterium]|nr:MAG: PDZ domain-containing protein [bacterium]
MKLPLIAAFTLIATIPATAAEAPKVGIQTLQKRVPSTGVYAVSAQGNKLASVGFNNTVQLYDVAADKPGPTLKVSLQDAKGYLILTQPLALSPEGKTLATGNADIRFWNTTTGKLEAKLPLQGTPKQKQVTALTFSPDGKQLAVATQDGLIRLFDARTRKWQATLQEKGPYSSDRLAFSPDGRQLAGGSMFRTSLWDVAKRRVLHHCIPPSFYDGLETLLFSPDGKQLVTGGTYTPLTDEPFSPFDTTGFFADLHIWAVASGRLQTTKRFKDERFLGATFAPNGAALAVLYSEAVRLFEPRTWKPLQAQGGPLRGGEVAWFLPGSKTLAVVNSEGDILRWTPQSLNPVLLGIRMDVAELTPEIREALQLDQGFGVRVVGVGPGTPAAKSGLLVGDIILDINGQKIHGDGMLPTAMLTRQLQLIPPGQKFSLGVLREGKRLKIETTVVGR